MPPLSAATRLSLSLIAGGAVANIYYNQPLLGLLVQVFGHDASVLVPTATLAGYGLGILGLVPLGDALPRRSLIVGQLLLLAAVLVLAAASTSLSLLVLASFLIGVLSRRPPSRRCPSRRNSHRTRRGAGWSAR